MGGIEWGQPGWLWLAGAVLLAGLIATAVLLGRRKGEGGSRGQLAPGEHTGGLRRAAGLILVRAVLVALIVAAMARPRWTSDRGPARLIVLADRSASMPPQWSADLLAQLAGLLPNARITAYSFAGQAQPIDLARPQLSPADPADGSAPGPAIQLATAVDHGHDILLLTDANFTAPANWPADRRLWALCPARGRAHAGLIDLLIAPATTQPADEAASAWAVQAILTSTRDDYVTASLSIRHGQTWTPLPGTEQRVLAASDRRRSIDWLISAPPGSQIRAELAADWDELPLDNQLAALVPPATGKPTVLLLTTQPDGPADVLADALGRLPGWHVLRQTPGELARANILDLPRPPDVVVLDDLPADLFSPAVLASLRRYLEGSGSLLTVGGANSFGAGHYFDPPLESLLPVTTRPRLRPAAAIVLLLDRSGSMGEPPTLPGATTSPAGAEEGARDGEKAGAGDGPARVSRPARSHELISKLDLLKQAVLSLPDLFAPGDRLEVIGFADQAKTVYVTPPGGQIDWQAVRRALLNVQSGGGTAVEPGIRSAADWLADQDVPRKHLLLLTDGEFTDLTIDQAEKILKDAAKSGRGKLTVSTFAAAEQADRKFLNELAQRFGGTFYAPANWGQLRDQFRDDLAGATADAIITADASRAVPGPGPAPDPGVFPGPGLLVQAHVPPSFATRPALPALPPIRKLLTTERRGQAEVWYSARLAPTSRPEPGSHDTGGGAERPWPLVAVGSIGAGRSAIIATSFQPDWTGGWTPAQRQELLSRLMADLAGGGDDPRLLLQLGTPAGPGSPGNHRLRVEVFANAGGPIDGLRLSADLVNPAGQTESTPLRQVGPGQYAATLAVYDACRVLIVEQRAEGDSRTVLRRTLSAPVPAELLHLTPMPAELDQLCREHGGRLLDSPAELSRLNLAPSPRTIELWPWLLLAAMVLWLADVVATRARGRH